MIRIMSGNVTATTINNDNSALVSNFPRQNDMQSGDRWIAYQEEDVIEEISTGISGYTRNVSGVSGKILLGIATPDMLKYIRDTINNGNLTGNVTVKLRHSIDGWQVYQGLLTITQEYDAGDYRHVNHALQFSRGVKI